MRHIAFVALLLMIAFIVACGKARTEEELIADIQKFKAEEKYAEVKDALEEFIDRFPESEKRAEMMKDLAMLYASFTKDFQKAIEVYNRITEEYSDKNLTAQCQFMKGYIYANNLKDFDMARTEYEKFLADFPDHELVPSVKWELKNLGKDLSEIELYPSDSNAVDARRKGSAAK